MKVNIYFYLPFGRKSEGSRVIALISATMRPFVVVAGGTSRKSLL